MKARTRFATLVATLGALAFTATPALAAPPTVTIQPASPVGYVTAPAKGTVNPAGHESSYRFDYITEAHFQENLTNSLPGFEGAASAGFGSLLGGAGITVVEAPLEGLSPATTYHLRLFAENNQSEREEAIAATFTTKAVAKPSVTINPVTVFGTHTAQFSGQANPNSPQAEGSTSPAEEEAFKTTYRFQCTPECPGLEGQLAADNTAHAVSVEASGLHAGLLYHVSLVAANAGGEETAGPVTFTTESLPPAIDATFANAVGDTEATLGAKINPGGASTTVHFEYITTEEFEADGSSFGAGTVKTPESAPVGFNNEDDNAEIELSGLEPDTAYRYRIIATNVKSPAGVTGPVKAFHTTLASPSFSGCPNEAVRRQNESTGLTDCRAYEMVSPVDKSGYDAFAALGYPVQASPSGDRISYIGSAAFPTAAGSAVPAGHLGSRTPAGWQTIELTPPTPQTTPNGGWFVGYDLSEDLSQVVVKVPNEALAPGATPGVFNLFLHHPDGSYTWVNSATPAVAPPAGCPPEFLSACFQFEDVAAFGGATPDFSHILFETTAKLAPEAPETFAGSLYESSGGQVHFVGILPDGSGASGGSTAGSGSSPFYSAGGTMSDGRVENAISANGSHIVFQAPSDEGKLPAETGQSGMTEVYDRIDASSTIELSAPNTGVSPQSPAAAPATFWTASKDGSRVFFTSAAALTEQSKVGDEGGEDLYEYDFGKPAGQRLTDLSPDAAPHGAKVQGVLDASDDGSFVYFVARGLLDGKGIEGQPNLYMVHEGQAPVFITTLANSDGGDWTSTAAALTAYVTPDGSHLAFSSVASLETSNFPTGYDNTDQKTGDADTEVYEYSADSGELLCGSCNPSGSRPTGSALIGGVSVLERNFVNSPFHHVRDLSDNGGRLFFTSPDVLSSNPNAKSPFVKLYEYEQEGEGTCLHSLGCHYLLSGPAHSTDDFFLDASASGKDVFFATRSRLTLSDTDTNIDVYDADAEGGYAQPPSPPPCEGDGCRGAGSTPPAAPSSATSHFKGPANPKYCSKDFVKRDGKCVKKPKSRKHRKRSHRRAGHHGGGNQ